MTLRQSVGSRRLWRDGIEQQELLIPLLRLRTSVEIDGPWDGIISIQAFELTQAQIVILPRVLFWIRDLLLGLSQSRSVGGVLLWRFAVFW
jgi:hypothetical protein